jgi:YEATS domain-containing protein 4
MIHKPVIFGTYAMYRGKKVAQDQMYAWCCYVRGKDGEDISRFISKVEFELDPSFPDPVYTVYKPPFQMHEVGWGQFPINIKLFFKDPNCKPVEAEKNLVLFDDMNPTTKRPIVTEDYNELVFIDPSPSMMRLLTVSSETQTIYSSNQAANTQNEN